MNIDRERERERERAYRMAIDFRQFTNDLADYFESYAANQRSVSQGLNDTAQFITNLYVINVLQGADISFRNVVISFKQNLLKSALLNAFNIGFNGNAVAHFSQMISVGLIGFWTGGQLSSTSPPPGSISIVSNMVTLPGTSQVLRIPTFPPDETATFKEFAHELVQMFRRHMLSLQGITIALVPAPPGAPVPTPFPWSGYQ